MTFIIYVHAPEAIHQVNSVHPLEGTPWTRAQPCVFIPLKGASWTWAEPCVFVRAPLVESDAILHVSELLVDGLATNHWTFRQLVNFEAVLGCWCLRTEQPLRTIKSIHPISNTKHQTIIPTHPVIPETELQPTLVRLITNL